MVKKLGLGLLLAIMVLFPLNSIAQATEAPVKKIKEMLYPTVMVDLRDGAGSGTIIFSNSRKHDSWKDEGISTLVLTNEHVVSTALLRLDDKERVIESVAKFWPEKVGGPYLFQKTWAVGSGMGNPPYPTEGLLSGINGKDVKGRSLYLSSSPIIFGNSGGSLWAYSKKRDMYEMIGVPSMVGAYGWGSIIPHIAWSRPITEIRAFLRENDFGFVLGDEDVAKKDPKNDDDTEKALDK